MENHNKIMNLNSIKSILTLRYDYTQKPLLPRLTWKDLEKKTDISQTSIEDTIKDELIKKIPCDYKGKISISLSGGIDSSLMLCLLKNLFPDNDIEAISIKFQDSYDETDNAAKIARKLDVNHHIIEIKNYLTKLQDAISITKLPFWDIHWLYVVEKSRKFSKYLVSGDGGDELFGGYIFRYSKFLSLVDTNSSVKERIIAYLSCHERDHVPDQEEIFANKFKFDYNDIFHILEPYFDNSLSPLEQLFLADYNGKLLYNFSIVNSRIAKFYNIESVTPILSDTMIRQLMATPTNQKYDSINNLGKLPLLKILGKYGIKELISKEKLGFSVNTKNLWKNYGYDMANEYLMNGQIINDGWIRKDWIASHINKKELDIRYVNKILGLLAFEIWYRSFNRN